MRVVSPAPSAVVRFTGTGIAIGTNDVHAFLAIASATSSACDDRYSNGVSRPRPFLPRTSMPAVVAPARSIRHMPLADDHTMSCEPLPLLSATATVTVDDSSSGLATVLAFLEKVPSA